MSDLKLFMKPYCVAALGSGNAIAAAVLFGVAAALPDPSAHLNIAAVATMNMGFGLHHLHRAIRSIRFLEQFPADLQH